MKKFKKAMALSLSLAMGLSLVACGKSDDNTTTTAPSNDSSTEGTPSDSGDENGNTSTSSEKIEVPDMSSWDDSMKINAVSWDDDFGNKLQVVLDAYPEVKPYVNVISLGCSGTDGTFQTSIDTLLEGDIADYPSLIPSDNSLTKYFSESDKTLDLYSIGFTKDMLANSYDFAIQFGTYGDELKAVTWQACPGSVFYNRAIAQEVFGTDDPDAIQAELADWDKFFAAADKLKEAGYYIVAGEAEIEYAVLDGKTTPWVKIDDNSESLQLDDTITTYLELSKKLADGGYTHSYGRWGEDGGWMKSMQDGQDVFCFFGCPWFIGSMKDGGATDGSWAACVGPQAYHWGGTYVCVGAKTPNPELCAFLLYELTCDPDIAVEITNKTGDCCNNKEGNERLINGELADDNSGVVFLGGQNPFEVWAAAAEGLDLSSVTYADSSITSYLEEASTAYNAGTYATVDEAIQYITDKCESELGLK
ncbi:MAG: extracellular solute-binding protein [Wujia sp.]